MTDKVQNWIDLGIINGDAAADSSAEIAATEKQNLTNIDNLKNLSNVKASDLTWNINKATVTIKQKNTISVQLRNNGENTGGNLDIDSGKHTYLVDTRNTNFNFIISVGNRDYEPRWGITTNYNVRLMTDKGIKTSSNNIIIFAKDAILYGGVGNIGGQG